MHASLTFFSEEFGSDFLPKEQKSVQEPYNVQRIRLHVIARTTLLPVMSMIKNKKQ